MRPAPPHFATCSTYKQHQQQQEGAIGTDDTERITIIGASCAIPRNPKAPPFNYARTRVPTMPRERPGSPASRPDDLGISRTWCNERIGTIDSPVSSIGPGYCDRSSYPSSTASSYPQSHLTGRPNLSLYSVVPSRERDSSLDSNEPPIGPISCQRYPRKAYMDLTDAIALLDETCPNQEVSPLSLTPRTPRTPLTPFPRGKRARSKSSDNSSSYSNEIVSEKATDLTRSQDKCQEFVKHRRPFLRKIGVSKTEDRTFLAKIAPRIIGKPYLEKIGPSRAVEKPFLEKIGTSKTLERFTFDALRELPRAITKRGQPIEPSPLAFEVTPERDDRKFHDTVEDGDDVLCIVKDEADDQRTDDNEPIDSGNARRSNGKAYLLKMYSFEAEDPSVMAKSHQDPVRGVSLDDALDSGPSSLPPSDDSREHGSSRSDEKSTSVAELVKCRVTMSEEIFTMIGAHRIASPRESTSWSNSPSDWSKRRSRRMNSSNRGDRDSSLTRVFPSDESTPNSPTKRPISPDREQNSSTTVARTKNFRPHDTHESPLKTLRQASNDEITDSHRDTTDNRTVNESSRDASDHERCKTRRQTFRAAMEKFGGEHGKTRRQASEEILDKPREIESASFEDTTRFDRRGISSDNLKLSRETFVASVPSTSSLGYQSGDSSLVSQRSSYHSQQDFVRGTLKILHDKFELQEVPSESYAAFKRRTMANRRNEEPRQPVADRKKETDVEVAREIVTKNHNENNNVTNSSRASLGENPSSREAARSVSLETRESKSSITSKSVLRKQDGLDQSDQETDTLDSRRPKRRIVNEPSQETMDLLTELRRVKSMLRTPSFEAETVNESIKLTQRYPKKILLTDREFCLSVERENSVRRRPSTLPGESVEVSRLSTDDETPKDTSDATNVPIDARTSRRQRASNRRGPALFEKRCLSLDYADDVKPPKPEARAISLVAPSRTPRSVDYEILDGSDNVCLDYDARSYSSDVFTSPSDENENETSRVVASTTIGSTVNSPEPDTDHERDTRCADLDIAIPVDHCGSPKRRVHAQGRTSDLYEIMSPRSTPFRVKKRLGRISIEDNAVKAESFTLGKVDCRSVAAQKRTKCFPL